MKSFSKTLSFGADFKLSVPQLMYKNECTQYGWYEKLGCKVDWRVVMTNYVCMPVCYRKQRHFKKIKQEDCDNFIENRNQKKALNGK